MSQTQLPDAFATFGWCRSTYTVVRSLASRGVNVHVGDGSRLAMSRFSRYATSFTQLPDFYAEPERYVTEVGRALKAKGTKVLLPCFEDIACLMEHKELLPEGTRMAVPSTKDWTEAEDKLDYIERVRAAGCPVPSTIKIESEPEFHEQKSKLGFPVVVKARTGHGARGVEICGDKRALETTFFRIIEDYSLEAGRWPILQKHLNGKKYKLDGVFEQGRPVGSCVFEILRCKGAAKFGTSTFRRTVDAADVVRYSHLALEALNWHGMFNTDWICDEHGVPHLIDINGRLSGAVGVCYEAGMDLPWLWYQVTAGLEPDIDMQACPNVYVRWLLGDCIAVLEHLSKGHVREVAAIFRPKLKCRHDDFTLTDPLPFVAQFCDYFDRFIRSRGSLRPASKEMIH